MLSAKLQDSLKCNISRKKWIIKNIFDLQIKCCTNWLCIARYVQSTQNKKFAYFHSFSRKTWAMKIFWLLISTIVSYKLILSLWVCIVRHAQSTQKTSLQYLCNISRETWKSDVSGDVVIRTKWLWVRILLLSLKL